MKKFLCFLLSGFVIMLYGCQHTTNYDDVVFMLKGEETIYVSENEAYTDPGYVSLVNQISIDPEIQGRVNENVPGQYEIIFSLTVGTKTYTLTRTVIVLEKMEKYFNQVSPLLEAKIFSPDFISKDMYSEFAGTFSPDYRFYFFTRRNSRNDNRLYYTEYVDGSWTVPSLSPISENVTEMEPHITPDGTYLYFNSKRENLSTTAIFVSSFKDDIWQEPVFVGTGLNDSFAMYITVANNKNLYFTSMDSKIYVMHYIDGVYQPAIFTGVSGAHAYISPDESYMLLDDSGLTEERTSIYISFNHEGIWSEPEKLSNEINHLDYSQVCPSVSPDKAFIFFARFDQANADIYWISIDVLEPYLKKEMEST